MKKIFFNLNINEKQIRTIEDLQDNFDIDDIYGYLKSGLLLKWCNSRGYEIAEQIEKIDKDASFEESIIELAEILKIDLSDELKDIIDGRNVMALKKTNINAFNKGMQDRNAIVQGCYNEYVNYKQVLFESDDNEEKIRALHELEVTYKFFFELERFDLFSRIIDSAPEVALLMISNPYFRRQFLDIDADGYTYSLENIDEHERQNRTIILEKLASNILDKNEVLLQIGCAKTLPQGELGQWHTILKKGKKVIILKAANGTQFNAAGCTTNPLSYTSLKRFLILDGLEFMSPISEYEIIYWEVPGNEAS